MGRRCQFSTIITTSIKKCSQNEAGILPGVGACSVVAVRTAACPWLGRRAIPRARRLRQIRRGLERRATCRKRLRPRAAANRARRRSDHEIGTTPLFFAGPLSPFARSRKPPRTSRDWSAARRSRSERGAVDEHDQIAEIVPAGLEQDGGVEDDRAARPVRAQPDRLPRRTCARIKG